MGRRGPAPKPTALKVIEGTFRPDRAPVREPKPKVAAPAKPKGLTQRASREWDRVVPQLLAVRVLTELDLAVLVGYCESWSLYWKAKAEVGKRGITVVAGSGTRIANPAVGVMNRAYRDYVLAGRELGLTPAARSRIEALPDEAAGRDEEAFLFGR